MEDTRVTVQTMPIGELRRRVEEAEKLLRVARQLARDELADPQRAEWARDRIASLTEEVNGLFPGLGDGGETDTDADADAETDADADAETDADPDPDADADADAETDAEDDDDVEWEIDVVKLRAALDNPVLMAKIPEGERARFRAMAERLLDLRERQDLYARVSAAFEELSRTTHEGAERVRGQLAAALTFEQLAAKYKA